MDDAARKVLKIHKTKIKDQLYLADRIMDRLEETDTIDEEISQKVRAERTNEEKIDKLLYYLKRRGPHAFSNFIDALKMDPPNKTLAQDLEREHDNIVCKTDKYREETQPDINFNTIPSKNTDVSTLTSTVSTELCHTNSRNDLEHTPMTQHTNFQYHRKRTNITNNTNCMSDIEPMWALIHQENLNTLYTQLKAHMASQNMRELSFQSPKPITFDMVIALQDEYMKMVDQCYQTIGVKDKTKSLRSHIVDFKANERKLKDEVKEKEALRNKLSHQYIKLENKHREIVGELKRLENENHILTRQNFELTTKNFELTVSLQTAKARCEEIIEKNSKQKQIFRESEVVINKNDFPDAETANPSRVSKTKTENRTRRRQSSIGCTSTQNNKHFHTPRRQNNATSASNNQGNLRPTVTENNIHNPERDFKTNPHVKFDIFSNGTANTSKLPMADVMIGNSASKMSKVVPDKEPATANESSRISRKRNNNWAKCKAVN